MYTKLNRKKLRLSAAGSVEVRVKLGDDKDFAWLQCMACEDALLPVEERDVFECVSCGYECTRAEARDLAARQISVMASFYGISLNAKEGFLWRLVGLFARRKRLQAPLS